MTFPVVIRYANKSHRGPGKVVENLEKGFDKLGIEHGLSHSLRSDTPVLHGYLQTMEEEMFGQWSAPDGEGVVVGPNLFVLPTDWPESQLKKFEHYLVPSQWVKDLYRTFPQLDHATIDVWPVGIDTDVWHPRIKLPKAPFDHKDILVYRKNRSDQDLHIVRKLLDRYGSRYVILSYGSYTESQLFDACKTADFAVLLTDTESQGIAYQQILSTGTPCYVFNKTSWDNEGKGPKVSATSVPYFDNRCGMITDRVFFKHYEEFLEKLGSFEPRNYILENLTLEKCAQDYYNILEKYYTLWASKKWPTETQK